MASKAPINPMIQQVDVAILGAACDVQAHLYSYSFATRPDWTHRYADWRQTHHYIRDTIDRYGLRPFGPRRLTAAMGGGGATSRPGKSPIFWIKSAQAACWGFYTA